MQGDKKKRFNEIKQEMSQIATKFSNNLLVSTCLSRELAMCASLMRAQDLVRPCTT